MIMKIVTISESEAREILNLLRTVQMNIAALQTAETVDNELFSLPFLGALNQAVNGLEGSIWEAKEDLGGDPFDPFAPSTN